jgi:ParB family chromosome partitioning protein
MLIHLSLTQLHLSEKNVRKTPNEAAHTEMCASLLHHGLQQNLVVVQDAEQRYAVIAGGRRLKALQALQTQGDIVPNIGEDWMIPCQIASAADATELSLVENTIRIAMHPADQFEAWRLLIEEGKSTAEVAVRFGVNEQLVRQRLKLGKVSPTLMQAYRDGQMDLEDLTAFTLCDDEARQLSVWEQVKDAHHLSPHQIRRLLTDGAVAGNSKLAKFVGEEAYQQAGGLITRDLFQEACYFENAALLESLALGKLNVKAAELRADWSFVDARLDADHTVMRGYTALEASIIGAPVGMKESFEAKIARYETLENGAYDDEDADEEALQQEYELLAAELEELKEQIHPYLDYTPEQKQASGCFLWIHHDGSLQIRGGMQRMTSHRSNSDTSEHSNVALETEGDMQGDDTVSHGISDAGDYSQSLKEDLGIYRTQMLQAAIADDFASAFDVMTYTLCIKQLRDTHSYMASPLSLSVETFRTGTSLKDADSTLSGKKLAEQQAVLSLDFLRLADDTTRFKAFCALPEIEKKKLFAYVVAQSVQGGLAGRMHPVLEMVASRLNVQAHLLWRPEESCFFKRIKKPQLLTLITEVIGSNWCSKVADQTKGQIASWLGRVFASDNAATSGMDAAALERIAQWMPERMGYNTHSVPDAKEENHAEERQSSIITLCQPSSESEWKDKTDLPEWMQNDEVA